MPIIRRFNIWKRDERGAFTLEATILFPIILMLIILFILFSLVIYEKVTLQYQANRIVSQLAHSWSSSTMNVQTGEMGRSDYVTNNGDGLYWRLKEFEINGISLPGGNVESKINRVGEFAGDVTFNSGLFTQEIKVELEKQLSLPSSVSNIFGINSIGATATHPVVEPVEVIRTTDFMLYGFEKFTGHAAQYFQFFEE